MSQGPSDALSVLLTNAWMDRRGGTETVIRDIALGLLRRGHRPIVYSPHLGPPAVELHQRGVAVIPDLARLAEPPDVIHGQHFIQTADAILHFPQAPAIQMCHAWQYWQEAPADFPQVYRYVAVDQTVRDRLVHSEQISPDRIDVVYNAVDLSRIPPRPQASAARPAKALAFTKFRSQIPLIAAVCRNLGIELDVLGAGGDRIVADPEAELVNYDLVFATARMAIEALCAGCAVVVCDSRGMAGMVTTGNLSHLRSLNFGLRSLVQGLSVEALSAEVGKYDAHEAGQVSERLRGMAGLEPTLDYLERTYREALQAPKPDETAIRGATLKFLQQALPRRRMDGRWPWMAEREAMEKRIQDLERDLAAERARNLGV